MDDYPYGTMIRSNFTGMILVKLRYGWVNLNNSVNRASYELRPDEWTLVHNPATPPPVATFDDVTRITVVMDNPDGLVFERYNAYKGGVELHLQDDGRTLKIFPKGD